ncbi:MAG: pentapeptide repeat-containing protein [Alphaproteobacteria bacterium]|nr:pentapeptide repeat-containing protein [Alphaproteobacteria bacterium]
MDRPDRSAPQSIEAGALRELLGQPFRAGEKHDLAGAAILGTLDLSGMAICGFDLTGAVFNDPVIARGAQFDGLTWFRRCRFLSGVDFSNVLFAHDARFDGAAFQRDAIFSKAEFRGIGCFDEATFRAAAFLDHMQVSGSFSADHARFLGTASLEQSECMGGLWWADTRFDGRCNLRGLEVHGRTWLRGATAGDRNANALARSIASYGYSWT